MEYLEHWPDIILSIILFVGIVGSFVPVIPGTGIILLGALFHGLITNFSPINFQVLLVLVFFFLLAQAGQYVVTSMGSKKFGSTKYGIIGAGVGMLAGFILPIPGGGFVGAFLGAFLAELLFALQDLKNSFKAGAGALLGAIFSLFFEFGLACTMAGLIFYSLFAV